MKDEMAMLLEFLSNCRAGLECYKKFDREDRWKGGDVREWRSPQELFIAEAFAWFVERVAVR